VNEYNCYTVIVFESFQFSFTGSFLPRDATQSAVLLRQVVRRSVTRGIVIT